MEGTRKGKSFLLTYNRVVVVDVFHPHSYALHAEVHLELLELEVGVMAYG